MDWINTNDRIPTEHESILVTDGKEIHTAHWCEDTQGYYSGGWECCHYCGGRSKISFEKSDDYCDRTCFIANYWMTLPELPMK